MRSLIATGLIILSMGVYSNDIILDKEVTGVNQEKLEVYEADTDIGLENNSIIQIEDTGITGDTQKDSKQVLEVVSTASTDNGLSDDLIVEEKKPVWKYVLGVLAVVALGIAL